MKIFNKFILLATLLLVSQNVFSEENPNEYLRLSFDQTTRELNLLYSTNPIFDEDGILIGSTPSFMRYWFREDELLALFTELTVPSSGLVIPSLATKIAAGCPLVFSYRDAYHAQSGYIPSDLEACVVIRDFGHIIFLPPEDTDNDGIDDSVDNCVYTPNPDQSDMDEDNIGDVCDDDNDNDNVPDDEDNCPLIWNQDQANNDSHEDSLGDVCDDDDDNDTVLDFGPPASDNCIFQKNLDQSDIDEDNIGDVCDPDMDGDGVDDNFDNCPAKSNSSQNDMDNDNIGDVCDPDKDGDGVDDEQDNCPLIDNPLQEDEDGNGIGDACKIEDDCDFIVVPLDNDKAVVFCV